MDLQMHLLDVFFDFTFPAFPILDKKSFWDEFNSRSVIRQVEITSKLLTRLSETMASLTRTGPFSNSYYSPSSALRLVTVHDSRAI
jgi:hypothetical protein